MTAHAGHTALLARIAGGEQVFARRNVHDAAEGRAFDALVDALFLLEAAGLITLRPHAPEPNRASRHGTHLRTGACALTPRGAAALTEWRAKDGAPDGPSGGDRR